MPNVTGSEAVHIAYCIFDYRLYSCMENVGIQQLHVRTSTDVSVLKMRNSSCGGVLYDIKFGDVVFVQH